MGQLLVVLLVDGGKLPLEQLAGLLLVAECGSVGVGEQLEMPSVLGSQAGQFGI
ncbi:hypothetical protein D3C78_395830 [compost metagenome]